MRRTRRTVPAVALAALALLGSACGGDSATDDDSTSAAGDPASTEDSGSAESPPEPAPLDGPISPCDLLLPEEVGHHLQMAIGEPAEDRVTGSCQYADALTTQLMPATDSPNASLDLALIGMGASERLDIAGQPAAVASDSYGASQLAVAVPRRHQTLSLTVSNFADGKVPGTGELAVPGDDRVVAAQEEALRELAEIALIRMGVADAG